MKKVTRISCDIKLTLDLAQIKELALVSPDEFHAAVLKAIGEKLGASYKEWKPDYFDDDEYSWLWEKYDEMPFRHLTALRDLLVDQYGPLQRMADIREKE